MKSLATRMYVCNERFEKCDLSIFLKSFSRQTWKILDLPESIRNGGNINYLFRFFGHPKVHILILSGFGRILSYRNKWKKKKEIFRNFSSKLDEHSASQ